MNTECWAAWELPDGLSVGVDVDAVSNGDDEASALSFRLIKNVL